MQLHYLIHSCKYSVFELFVQFSIFFSTGEQDLHDVLSAAIEVAARWKYIGDMFQLSPGTLDAIEIANHYQPNDCLREVILRWLRGSGSSHSPPTWRRVVEVVGSPTGGNNPQLARRIASQHCKGMAMYYCAIVSIPGCIVMPNGEHMFTRLLLCFMKHQWMMITTRLYYNL